MTTSTLISKLKKLKISYTIINVNGYNMDISFSINGMNFKAGYFKDENIIQDYCREICYNQSEQEMQRRFFENFNKLIRYANI
jgi:hypothetical protein